MTEHQRETAFLRRIIRLNDTDEHRKLEARIAQVQRDERCVKRAAWLMALFAALGLALLGYGAVLLENFPYNTSRFAIRLICELGLGALVALVALFGVMMIYRMKLNQLREECRRSVTTILGSQPVTSQDRS